MPTKISQLPVTQLIGWGVTTATPSLKRNGVNVDIRLGDDSDYAPLRAADFFSQNRRFFFQSQGSLETTADGAFSLKNNAGTAIGALTLGTITASGSTTYSAAAAGTILKQGANGRVGTFVLNGVTPVTVSNTSVAITDAVIISLNTVGGTVGAVPALQTITAATGFTVAGTIGDTSTYNYAIIKNAA